MVVIRRLGERARGIRIIVSRALELSLVAAGRLDGFVSLKADIVYAAGARRERSGDDSGGARRAR